MSNLAKYIDHTLLTANATDEQVLKICDEAMEYGFCSVCVNSANVELASSRVKESGVKVCSVVGFPLGAMATKAKAYEAKVAIEDGADEIDMVVNVGWVKSGNWDKLTDDISQLRMATKGNILKVILETALLSDDEIIKVSQICKDIKVDFVKTSTGFATRGASVEDIVLMKSVVGDEIGIKASGGIRDRAKTLEMIDAGATRIGASAGIAIVNGVSSQGGDY